MKGTYQVWHPTQPEPTFPAGYRRVAVIEADSLIDAAMKGGGRLAEGDIVIDPARLVNVFEDDGTFGRYCYGVRYERKPGTPPRPDWLQKEDDDRDRAFTAAVLGIDAPTPEQVKDIVTGQADAYLARAHDNALWNAYDEYYEQWEREESPKEDTYDPTKYLRGTPSKDKDRGMSR